jgi:hypothetical protein
MAFTLKTKRFGPIMTNRGFCPYAGNSQNAMVPKNFDFVHCAGGSRHSIVSPYFCTQPATASNQAAWLLYICPKIFNYDQFWGLEAIA